MKVIFDVFLLSKLARVDRDIRALNDRKIQLLFKGLDITYTNAEFATMSEWPLILIAVPDKQMAVQLNKMSAYVPNLKFIVDEDAELFEVRRGEKARRVWKER